MLLANINHVDEEVTTSKLDEEIRTNDQENIVSSNYCLPVDNLSKYSVETT